MISQDMSYTYSLDAGNVGNAGMATSGGGGTATAGTGGLGRVSDGRNGWDEKDKREEKLQQV
jgi:hypothetical protein